MLIYLSLEDEVVVFLIYLNNNVIIMKKNFDENYFCIQVVYVGVMCVCYIIVYLYFFFGVYCLGGNCVLRYRKFEIQKVIVL